MHMIIFVIKDLEHNSNADKSGDENNYVNSF